MKGETEVERDGILMKRYGFTQGELNRIDAEVRFVMWRWIHKHGFDNEKTSS